MNTRHDSKQLQRLSRLVDQFQAIELGPCVPNRHKHGQYQSLYKGEGLEFVDSRRYEVGDDVRKINWKAYARKAGPPEFMLFSEQRQVKISVICNLEPSMNYGTQELALYELAAVITASILSTAGSLGINGLYVGYGRRVMEQMGGRRGGDAALGWRKVLMSALRGDVDEESPEPASLVSALRELPTQSSLTFLVSDFAKMPSEKEQTALRKAARRHEIVCLRVVDLRQRELPVVPLFRWLPIPAILPVRDCHGQQREVLATKAASERHAREFREHDARLAELFTSLHCSYATFTNDEPRARRRHKLLRLFTGPRRAGVLNLEPSKTEKGATQ